MDQQKCVHHYKKYIDIFQVRIAWKSAEKYFKKCANEGKIVSCTECSLPFEIKDIITNPVPVHHKQVTP